MADDLSNEMVVISDLERDILLCPECLSISFWQKPYAYWELVAGIG